MIIIMYAMTNDAMHGMMNGSMRHGMGWGGSLIYWLFMLMIFAILILTILALLKYLRNKS